MTNLLRNTLIAVSLLTIGQNLAKASDFTVTTVPHYGGGYTSTYRSLPARGSADWLADRGVFEAWGPAPANGCDLAGIGGFETVTRLYPGEARCTGAVPRR
jgi:hypothetical protein